MDVTILYYTSNRENPKFEQKVKDNILENCGDIPIISISHKPINFGKNICVGDVGTSGFNMFRQVQIGLKETKTKFVLSAEADCLYPPDYFTYVPEKEDVCYRNNNLYVLAHKRALYWKKSGFGATHAQIVGREWYLDQLNKLFEGASEWSVKEKNFPKERGLGEDVFPEGSIEMYETQNPVVQIKTSESMRHHTESDMIDLFDLPYWGDSKEFRHKYLLT